MATKVTWLGRASDKIAKELLPVLGRELRAVFSDAGSISVYDCFSGYSLNQRKKLVLGVEVRSRESYHTHVVKLGEASAVANDYDGWRKCMLKHNFASRVFVAVAKTELPGDRAAIVYEDAYRLFGYPDEAKGPQSLETVVFWAINDDRPDPVSVERVIRQIYTDLHRWFYRAPLTDANAARAFYQRRLRRALDRWTEDEERRVLRRDLIWMLCSHETPGCPGVVSYADPFDYVTWALRHGRFPQTLIGRSHGDLHGRNILVGVERGEVEYPAVFDYGEMNDDNVLVWDFVKLEVELKVRFLFPLYQDESARKALFALQRSGMHRFELPEKEPSAASDPRSLRLRQLLFGFQFELLLADLTARIHRLSEPQSPEPPGGREITGHKKIDRALAILLRIRQEAALLLGDRQPQRGGRSLWKDEYYFALAVYGLSTAKFDYKESETGFALVSAGVACAQVDLLKKDAGALLAMTKPEELLRLSRETEPYPCFRIPLAHAHRLWKAKQTRSGLKKALEMIEPAVKRFGHAVPLLQEYALLLAEAGQHEKSLGLLTQLEDLCAVFRDEETLSRIGRTCKSQGDLALAQHLVPVSKLHGHPAWQWYDAALRRYRQAFEMRRHYYPGVNAATLATILGLQQESRSIAMQTLTSCHQQDLSKLTSDERFWVLVSEGEASLLLGRSADAVTYYQQALAILDAGQAGMAQSAYNQVCRLGWAIGETVCPVIEAFRAGSFDLEPGLLGDGRFAAE